MEDQRERDRYRYRGGERERERGEEACKSATVDGHGDISEPLLLLEDSSSPDQRTQVRFLPLPLPLSVPFLFGFHDGKILLILSFFFYFYVIIHFFELNLGILIFPRSKSCEIFSAFFAIVEYVICLQECDTAVKSRAYTAYN